jgi:hypothetical protein
MKNIEPSESILEDLPKIRKSSIRSRSHSKFMMPNVKIHLKIHITS